MHINRVPVPSRRQRAWRKKIDSTRLGQRLNPSTLMSPAHLLEVRGVERD